MGNPQTVLDPAAGRGEFIGSIDAAERWFVDEVAYPEAESDPDVKVVTSKIMDAELPEDHFDGVYASNFLEHLFNQEEIAQFLERMRTVMKSGGRIAIMGPNYRYCADEYWDCADHWVALTHVAIAEHLYAAGFEPVKVVPRYLPYSFRGILPPSKALTRMYLQDADRLEAARQAVPGDRPALSDAGPGHRRRRLRRRQPQRRARRAPSRLGDRRPRQPDAPRLGAQPAAAARGGGRVPPRRRARARRHRGRRRVRRDDRVLGRALGARRDGRRRLLGADEPARRLQLHRAGARAGRLRRLPLDQPRLPRGARSSRWPSRRRRRGSSWPPSSRSPAPARRGSPSSSRCRARGRSTAPPSSPPRC